MSENRIRDFLISDPAVQNSHRDAIDSLYHADETSVVSSLLDAARMEPAARERVNLRARELVQSVRDRREERGLLDAFMQQYDLSS